MHPCLALSIRGKGCIVPATNFLLLELRTVSIGPQIAHFSERGMPGRLTLRIEEWPFCRTVDGRI